MSESQKLVLLVFSGTLGLLIGSFLNVCIFRLPRNCMSIVKPRSRCIKCLTWIAWYDNLPVLSWLILGGKCRGCRTPISPRYACVELLTGALYAVAGWRALYGTPHPGWREAAVFAVQAWFLATLIVCTFIDYDFRILPDEVTISGIVIGLGVSALFPFLHERGLPSLPLLEAEPTISPDGLLLRHVPPLSEPPWFGSLVSSAFGAAVGAGIILAAALLGKLLFAKRIKAAGETQAMGFGDVKYLAMFGAVLGWKGMLLAFMVACFTGATFGVGKGIATRRLGYVPFGPFLSIGAGMMSLAPAVVHAAVAVYMSWMNALSHAFYRLIGHPLP